MTPMRDAYETLAGEGESEHVVDRSRFLGFAFPAASLDQALSIVEGVRKEHYNARHVCFGLRIGHGAQRIDRSNDDGEPARTGGFPLWQLLDGADATDALLVVVRYYGGVKLGTGGLARAYREAGRLALDDAGIVTVHPEHIFELVVPYSVVDTLQHRMESMEGLRLIDTNYEAEVTFELAAQWPRLDAIRSEFAEILQVSPDQIAPFDEP